MGKIRRILASVILKTLPKCWDNARIEAGEERLMHFHWRDLRILCHPSEQFESLHSAIAKGYSDWDRQFVKDRDIIVSKVRIPEEIVFGNELKIEETINGVIHFHYRDIRLELSPEDFLTMARIFTTAADVYKKKWGEEQEINVDEINPGDRRHRGTTRETWRRGEADWDYHQEGIEIIKNGLERNGQILPILVMRRNVDPHLYQRLDGFKRLMAYKELGINKIPCFVIGRRETGGQDGMSFWKFAPIEENPEDTST